MIKKSLICVILQVFCILSMQNLVICDEKLGDQFFKKGDFRRAAEEYTKAFKQDNKNGKLILKIASAYEKMKWYSQANKYWKIYLDDFDSADKEIKDKLAYSHRWIAYNFYQDGNFEDAIEELKKSIGYNYDFIDAYYWLARIYHELGDFENAIRMWQKVLEIDPKNENAKWFLKEAEGKFLYGEKSYKLYLEGYKLYENKKFQDSLDKYKQAYEENEKFVSAAYWIARINYELNNFKEAIYWWEKVIENDNTNEKAYFFLKESKRKLQESEEKSKQGNTGKSQ